MVSPLQTMPALGATTATTTPYSAYPATRRRCWCGGNSSMIAESTCGIIAAAPAPPASRASASMGAFTASADSSEPAVNATAPARNTRR
ncbi:MAG: hypothetical protein AUG44_16080 [Actinobacteria bacterium 13_1_20CM_3_71_11]|nr:MAG: hypothetical protein AUG44_16080 [Actinobacteria bacterium 13_1_20CM_3_71_11]